MQKIYFFSILGLLYFIAGCRSTPQKTTSYTSLTEVKTESIWEFDAQKSYAQGEVVKITLKNSSKEEVVLYDPIILHIEQQNNQQWQKIRTLYCACGASCPPPPNELSLETGHSHTFHWNQKEEWCEQEPKKLRSVQRIKEIEAGTYRLAIRYRKANEKIQIDYYEFAVK